MLLLGNGERCLWKRLERSNGKLNGGGLRKAEGAEREGYGKETERLREDRVERENTGHIYLHINPVAG